MADTKKTDRYVGIRCGKCGVPMIMGEKLEADAPAPIFSGPARYTPKCEKCGFEGTYGTDQVRIFNGDQVR